MLTPKVKLRKMYHVELAAIRRPVKQECIHLSVWVMSVDAGLDQGASSISPEEKPLKGNVIDGGDPGPITRE